MDNLTDLPKVVICSSDIDSETLEAIWIGHGRINGDCRLGSQLASPLALARRRRPSSKIMLPFIHPFTAIVAGPYTCGKTRFVFRLIDNASSMISPAPTKIVYFSGEYQQLFNQYPHTEFYQGLPNIEDFDG